MRPHPGPGERRRRVIVPPALLALLALSCFACDDDPAIGRDDGSIPSPDARVDATPDAMSDGMPDVSIPSSDAAHLDATADVMIDPAPDALPDATEPAIDAMPDATADATPPPDAGPGPAPAWIRGRFESTGPIRACGQLAQWQAPDGFLLRMRFDVCGDDMAALADTIVANLDAAAARGARALLDIGQGPFLPPGWLADCETWHLQDPRFEGDLCLPWDPAYQARLHDALVEHIGPAVAGHPALAGVYFTISTMTNGSEMHFRVARSSFPYPGDDVFRGAYLDVMDTFAAAFAVPVLIEAGHCIFADPPGGAVEPVDCETPLALYRHARDTYGRDRVGVAVWNCAERFFWGAAAVEAEARPLLEEATADRVSFGCQTVGNFTDAACQFTDPAVGDYGEPGGVGMPCPASASYDPEGACVDTMAWFTGEGRRTPTSVALRGTWAELWSVDVRPDGVYRTSEACRAAVDRLAP